MKLAANVVRCTLVVASSAACAAAPPMPDPPADHPASAEAAESPVPQRSGTLALPGSESAPAAAPTAPSQHGHGR